MGRFAGGLLLGLVAGGAIIFFVFVGVPRAAKAPGIPIRPPDAQAPAGSAQLVLKPELFNAVLDTIFREIREPAFPLSISDQGHGAPHYEHAMLQQQPCDGQIRILREGSGVRTGLRFENGRVTVPLAFAGSYNSPIGCYPFTGWAQANFELRFDAAQQSVFGRVNVETVNLDGVNPLISGIVTPVVQNSINNRVNPILLLRGDQLAVELPVSASGGSFKARVSDVRAEVKEDALNLVVIYDFSGSAGLPG
jgi:hypothetical protein